MSIHSSSHVYSLVLPEASGQTQVMRELELLKHKYLRFIIKIM